MRIKSPSQIVTIMKSKGLQHLFETKNSALLEDYVKKFYPEARVDSVRRIGMEHKHVPTKQEKQGRNSEALFGDWYAQQLSKI